MDDLDEAANMKGQDGAFDKSGLKLQEVEAEDFERNALDDEEALEAEALAEQQKQIEQSPLKELFRDPETN